MNKNSGKSKRFQELYEKYTLNTISDSELNELLELAGNEKVELWIEDSLKTDWQDIQEIHPFTRTKIYSLNTDRRSNLIRTAWKAAASLALFAAISIWYLNRDLGWQEYSTGNGETLQVVLSDQSQILLNANSRIRWDKNWQRDKIREIEMSGEAFFEIEHMKDIPLNVTTPSATIQVLGTSFNVREDILGTDVYLHTGKIKLGLASALGEDTSLILTHGDRIIKRTKSDQVEKYTQVQKNEAASWTEGELKFRNQPLEHILIRLGGIYGKQFVVQDTSLLSIPMDVGVPYANWELMKSALELSLSVELEEDGRIVRITNQYVD